MGAFRRRTFLVFPDLVTCTVVFPDDIPRLIPRLNSVCSCGVGSLLTVLGFAAYCSLVAGTLEGAGSLDNEASAVAFLLIEKKDDEDCAGGLEGIEVLDVIDPFRASPRWVLGTLSSRSSCFPRKPKVPLEAIFADGSAPHSN